MNLLDVGVTISVRISYSGRHEHTRILKYCTRQSHPLISALYELERTADDEKSLPGEHMKCVQTVGTFCWLMIRYTSYEPYMQGYHLTAIYASFSLARFL